MSVMLSAEQIKNVVEAALLAHEDPLPMERILTLFSDEERPEEQQICVAISSLQQEYQERGIELIEVSSGYRIQTRAIMAPWITRLWEEKPPRYTRATLETLALIAYKQPVTRAEIEEVRGVGVSTQIIHALEERGWIREVGHKEVPGRPALFATTRQFLDYFNLKELQDLPSLAEIQNLDAMGSAVSMQHQPDLFALSTGTAEQLLVESFAAGADVNSSPNEPEYFIQSEAGEEQLQEELEELIFDEKDFSEDLYPEENQDFEILAADPVGRFPEEILIEKDLLESGFRVDTNEVSHDDLDGNNENQKN